MEDEKRDETQSVEITFLAIPKNVEVWKAGKPLGTAPGPFTIEGEVTLTFKHAGYNSKSLVIRPKDAPVVEVELSPILNESDMRWMNIPPEFWRAKIEKVQDKPRPVIASYQKRVRELIRKPAGLLLTGESGVGKTAIATIIMKAARVNRFSCYFVSVWELREMLRNQIPFDESKSMLDRCREVDLLVIDHLKQEDLKEHYVNLRFLEELVTYRGQHKRTTIVTTAMPPAVLAGEMKAFLKMTQGYMVHFDVEGEDLRKKLSSTLATDVLGKTRS